MSIIFGKNLRTNQWSSLDLAKKLSIQSNSDPEHDCKHFTEIVYLFFRESVKGLATMVVDKESIFQKFFH